MKNLHCTFNGAGKRLFNSKLKYFKVIYCVVYVTGNKSKVEKDYPRNTGD